MVTLVDRSAYTPEVAGEVGAGSALERLPADVLRIIDLRYPLHNVGNATVAGRSAEHWEFAVPAGDATFPRGPLHVWLDSKTSYPLALRDAAGREIRFDSVAFNAAIDPRLRFRAPARRSCAARGAKPLTQLLAIPTEDASLVATFAV